MSSIRQVEQSSNPEFALDRELRACLVTRDLIRQIESYLLASEKELLGELAPDPERRYTIAVHDTFGVESFRSAADIPTIAFPETTESVRLVLGSPHSSDGTDPERFFKVKLAFRSAHGGRLLIRVRGPHARERVVGLLERIEQLIEAHTIDSWLFRRREWVIGICQILTWFGGLLWLLNTWPHLAGTETSAPSRTYWAWTAAIATAAGYLAIIRAFVPPCAFETTRWSKVVQWRHWAKFGFASLVIFEGLATILWRFTARFIALP